MQRADLVLGKTAELFGCLVMGLGVWTALRHAQGLAGLLRKGPAKTS